MLYIIKRDGRKQLFIDEKLISSINKAAEDVNMKLEEDQYKQIVNTVKNVIDHSYFKLNGKKYDLEIEKLQDSIEKGLYICGFRKIRESYKLYREERNRIRDTKSNIMNVIKQIGISTDRDNANVGNNFSSKLLRIASESNKWNILAMMPKKLSKWHEQFDLYYHDLDSFNLSTNCLHIPTRQMLTSGFNTGYGTLNVPKRIETAAELSCILLQSTQNDMFGGQSHPNFDNDLGLFIEPTREEIKKDIRDIFTAMGYNPQFSDEQENFKLLVNIKLKVRVHQAMQGIVYNLNTMHSRAGQMWAV